MGDMIFSFLMTSRTGALILTDTDPDPLQACVPIYYVCLASIVCRARDEPDRLPFPTPIGMKGTPIGFCGRHWREKEWRHRFDFLPSVTASCHCTA